MPPSAVLRGNYRGQFRTWWWSTANCGPVCLRWKSRFVLTVTLTFHLFTWKYNQFIFVPNCTYALNLVKSPKVICNVSWSQTFSVRSHMHAQTRTHIQVFIRLRGSRKPHLATKLNLATSHNLATPLSYQNFISQPHKY